MRALPQPTGVRMHVHAGRVGSERLNAVIFLASPRALGVNVTASEIGPSKATSVSDTGD